MIFGKSNIKTWPVDAVSDAHYRVTKGWLLLGYERINYTLRGKKVESYSCYIKVLGIMSWHKFKNVPLQQHIQCSCLGKNYFGYKTCLWPLPFLWSLYGFALIGIKHIYCRSRLSTWIVSFIRVSWFQKESVIIQHFHYQLIPIWI